jgi:hypothetical protein
LWKKYMPQESPWAWDFTHDHKRKPHGGGREFKVLWHYNDIAHLNQIRSELIFFTWNHVQRDIMRHTHSRARLILRKIQPYCAFFSVLLWQSYQGFLRDFTGMGSQSPDLEKFSLQHVSK